MLLQSIIKRAAKLDTRLTDTAVAALHHRIDRTAFGRQVDICLAADAAAVVCSSIDNVHGLAFDRRNTISRRSHARVVHNTLQLRHEIIGHGNIGALRHPIEDTADTILSVLEYLRCYLRGVFAERACYGFVEGSLLCSYLIACAAKGDFLKLRIAVLHHRIVCDLRARKRDVVCVFGEVRKLAGLCVD